MIFKMRGFEGKGVRQQKSDKESAKKAVNVELKGSVGQWLMQPSIAAGKTRNTKLGKLKRQGNSRTLDLQKL